MTLKAPSDDKMMELINQKNTEEILKRTKIHYELLNEVLDIIIHLLAMEEDQNTLNSYLILLIKLIEQHGVVAAIRMNVFDAVHIFKELYPNHTRWIEELITTALDTFVEDTQQRLASDLSKFYISIFGEELPGYIAGDEPLVVSIYGKIREFHLELNLHDLKTLKENEIVSQINTFLNAEKPNVEKIEDRVEKEFLKRWLMKLENNLSTIEQKIKLDIELSKIDIPLQNVEADPKKIVQDEISTAIELSASNEETQLSKISSELSTIKIHLQKLELKSSMDDQHQKSHLSQMASEISDIKIILEKLEIGTNKKNQDEKIQVSHEVSDHGEKAHLSKISTELAEMRTSMEQSRKFGLETRTMMLKMLNLLAKPGKKKGLGTPTQKKKKHVEKALPLTKHKSSYLVYNIAEDQEKDDNLNSGSDEEEHYDNLKQVLTQAMTKHKPNKGKPRYSETDPDKMRSSQEKEYF
jgi:hypothetical protein